MDLASRHGALLELVHTIILTVLELVVGCCPVAVRKGLDLVLAAFFGVLVDTSGTCSFASSCVIDANPGFVVALLWLFAGSYYGYLYRLTDRAGIRDIRKVARVL
jgi:hypothetical protein